MEIKLPEAKKKPLKRREEQTGREESRPWCCKKL
jgi:hypothetical protein